MHQRSNHRAAVFGWGLATSLLGSTMLAGAPARAVAAAAASPAQVSEIIVTSEKREELLQAAPMSIQALDSRRLDELNITEFQDYIKFMPSVSFQTTGVNQTSIYMRGVASGDNAN